MVLAPAYLLYACAAQGLWCGEMLLSMPGQGLVQPVPYQVLINWQL